MSDTDDTDVLILIPPDYFLVDSSDSEESVGFPSSFNYRNNYQHVQNNSVNELRNQVSDLESRIVLIENKETYQISDFGFGLPTNQTLSALITSSLPVIHSSELSLQAPPKRENRSVNDVDYHILRKTLTGPDYYPCDHASISDQQIDGQCENFSCDSGAIFTEPFTPSLSTSSDSFMESPSMATKSTNTPNLNRTLQGKMTSQNHNDGLESSRPQNKTDLIDEIDNFLDSVKKTQQKVQPYSLPSIIKDKREHVYQCGDNVGSVPNLHFGLRDLSHLPVREQPVTKKYFAPLESNGSNLSYKNKRLSLPEVDKLLDEMEATQLLIEKKLKMKEMQFGKGDKNSSSEQISFPQRPASCGETIGSVPDLGFGVRDLMTKPSSFGIQGSKEPVDEPRVTKRRMSLCGMNPTEQSGNAPPNTSKSSKENQFTDSSPQHPSANSNQMGDQRKLFVPRRLELGDDPSTIPDLGFGLKTWYKNNDVGTNTGGKSDLVIDELRPLPANSFIQGGLPSSIPDLGFGLRNLWTDTETSGGTSSCSVHPHSSDPSCTHCQHVSRARTIHSLNSHENSKNIELIKHSQASQFQENREGLPVQKLAEVSCLRKVDFTSQSIPQDSMSLNVDYGSSKAPTAATTSAASHLPSLSGLWNKPAIVSTFDLEDDVAPLKHKLEEERYRRQHCEQIIQQLQVNLLEEQQKLAVAVQVDMGKDQAILQFQGAWSRLVHHWNELEEQRHNLALKRQEDTEKYKKTITETVQKAKRCELEVSKALDLAQGYKEKCEILEQEKQLRTEEIQQLHHKLKELEKAVTTSHQEKCNVLKESEDVVHKMAYLEEESKKDKSVLLSAKKELDKKSKALTTLEADVSALKEEKGTLQLTLRDEKSKSSTLEQQKRSLQTAVDESRKKEKLLREEVQNSTAQLERLKIELRDFYQDQVEIVVSDKLREFQGQLDVAEKSLRDELESREQAINDTATKQIRQIMEKHQLEIKLLEEKHKEELQLCQLKLTQAFQQIYRLETKMKSHNSRKGELVEQLHDVMETQWQQALRIINGNSPLTSKPQTKPVFNGIDDEHAVPLPHNNIPLISNNPGSRGRDDELKQARVNLISRVPPLQLPPQSARSSNTDDFSFAKDGQVTHRVADDQATKGQLSEQDLKKYIEMLLNRSPGNPIPDERSSTCSWQLSPQQGRGDEQHRHKEIMSTDINQLTRWENVDRLDTQSRQKQLNNQLQLSAHIPEFDLTKLSQNSVTGKPPWK